MIRSALAARLRRIAHAHSDRTDGPVGSPRVAGHREVRSRIAATLGGDPDRVLAPDQVHGTRVLRVDASTRAGEVGEADGLVTDLPGVVVMVQGADCPLVLLADDAAGAAAVVHSGWRGTVARATAHGVRALEDAGGRAATAVAAVFPGIGPCCFEVGPEVVEGLRAAFGRAAAHWVRPGAPGTDRAHADLAPAIVRTLLDAGVPRDGIEVVPGCTACGGRLFSHRASRGGPERHGLFAVVRRS